MTDLTFDTASRVILMDLNVALSSNFDQMRRFPMAHFVEHVETYRPWMVELLRAEYVVLITAREARWKDLTLHRLLQTTGWNPQEALFNNTGISGKDAPKVKSTLLDWNIMDRPTADPARFIAIESNMMTRAMYQTRGIYAVDAERTGTWAAIPDQRPRQLF